WLLRQGRRRALRAEPLPALQLGRPGRRVPRLPRPRRDDRPAHARPRVPRAGAAAGGGTVAAPDSGRTTGRWRRAPPAYPLHAGFSVAMASFTIVSIASDPLFARLRFRSRIIVPRTSGTICQRTP